MQDPKTAIGIFCARYGLDYLKIAFDRESPYTIPHQGDGFDGRVSALRIREYGRLGNRFYQILNAMLLARQLGCVEIQMDHFAGGPEKYPVVAEGIRVVLTAQADTSRATLEGNFFAIVGFEPLLEPLQPDFVDETLRHFVKPVFSRYDEGGDPGGDDELVMHFRGGDVFPGPPGQPSHPYYVPPPVSFYAAAVKFAINVLKIRRVRLVAEDRRHIAIEVIEAMLQQSAIPFEFQSRSLLEDFGTMMHARHLVVPFTTFSEAAALLSSTLKTYIGFRDLEAHAFLYRRAYSLLEATLHHRGVALYVVDDVDGRYIPRRGWANTPAHHQLIGSYPESSLRVNQKIVYPTWELDPRPHGLTDALAAARREASLCRAALRRSQVETERMQDKCRLLRIDLESLAAIANEYGWLAFQEPSADDARASS